MTHSRRLLFVCVGFALLFSAGSASAQNLLVNPNFDTDSSGWDHVTGTATFDSTVGSPTPGSAQWTQNVGPNLAVFGGVGQCVSVTPGTTYDFSGQLLMTNAPAGGGVKVALAMYGTSTCAPPSAQGSDFSASLVSAIGSWQTSSGQFSVPSGTFGIRFMQGLVTGPTGGDFTVNVDSGSFAVAAAVPTLGTSWLVLSLAGMGAAGVVALRRRRPA